MAGWWNVSFATKDVLRGVIFRINISFFWKGNSTFPFGKGLV